MLLLRYILHVTLLTCGIFTLSQSNRIQSVGGAGVTPLYQLDMMRKEGHRPNEYKNPHKKL